MKLSPSYVLALLAAGVALPVLAQDSTAPATPAPATTEAPAAAAPAAEAPAAAPAAPVSYDGQSVIATVNGTPVLLSQLGLVFESLPEQYRSLPGDVLFPALLEQVINQMLLAEEGTKQGLGDSPMVKLAVENTRRDEIAGALVRAAITAEVTDAAITAAYEKKVAEMPAEQEANASHILVETEEKAKELVAQLAAGGDFVELAKQSSDGPSAANGGQLGWFSRGQMVPPFEEAAFALAPGAISAPVQTQFGWHVIKLNELRDKPKPTLEEMRQQILGELSEGVVKARIEALRTAAKIERPETGIPTEALRDPALLGR